MTGDLAQLEAGRRDQPARARLGLDQHRRREGLPRGGRGGGQSPTRTSTTPRSSACPIRGGANGCGRRAATRGPSPGPGVDPGALPGPHRRLQGAARATSRGRIRAFTSRQARLSMGARRRPRVGGRRRLGRRPTPTPGGLMKTPLSESLGIEFPIFAFSHCRDVVAAVTNAGGFGVLGCARLHARAAGDRARLDRRTRRRQALRRRRRHAGVLRRRRRSSGRRFERRAGLDTGRAHPGRSTATTSRRCSNATAWLQAAGGRGGPPVARAGRTRAPGRSSTSPSSTRSSCWRTRSGRRRPMSCSSRTTTACRRRPRRLCLPGREPGAQRRRHHRRLRLRGRRATPVRSPRWCSCPTSSTPWRRSRCWPPAASATAGRSRRLSLSAPRASGAGRSG